VVHRSAGQLALTVLEGITEWKWYQGNLKDSGLMASSSGRGRTTYNCRKWQPIDTSRDPARENGHQLSPTLKRDHRRWIQWKNEWMNSMNHLSHFKSSSYYQVHSFIHHSFIDFEWTLLVVAARLKVAEVILLQFVSECISPKFDFTT